MTSSPPAKAFDWRNFRLRAISAVVLAPSVLLVVWLGGWLFLALLAGATALLAVEWGRMSAPRSPFRAALGISIAVLVALFTAAFGEIRAAWLILLLGALGSALFARARGVGERPADEAFGVLYLGAPALTLLWLRNTDGGRDWVLVLLAVAWSADIAAFLIGSALKGPKLWPRFSPNKTWSGFIGGLVAAALAAIAVTALLGRDAATVGWAAPVGLVTGLATMAGDLWESMLKRRFGVKDSGQLIPGHGGLLDRVDGLMFAVLVLAGVRLIAMANGSA
jgi:phosphatidate cytidylyltransferase